MAIKPFPTKIFIKLDSMKAGALVLDNIMLSESGEVVAIGEEVSKVKIGDKVVVKIWGCDHCEIDGENYYVTDIESKALLCVME